ncbi:enoyl-CoA hydratase-related protein [Conexibacter woesei]|uniref:Enoyl-CoA hydratase/isomerase n=1 Tax=Conexibacter woesei (strain DSM 14684 / CCUG 47730 / CIP 108061 / JCM 11494 / NBRC 100937 / ID131577) TaxID=469383 RepID=D3F6J0_CONWI|nr:enoyl-CoA hydratase-related protein [Conexibacter woesei]ADB50757.1 Enoyl-CoA hydratase/isomerase [Conexibacter woesei DSM 14684]
MSDYEDIRVELDGDGVVTIAIDREATGNKLRVQTARELAHALRAFRDERAQRVAILTGAGDKFFCIGGEHDPLEHVEPSATLPIIDVYELIDTVPKPVIAAVNGFAVGGGNVLQTVCDLTVAAEHAVFRQVGPMVGSFDAGFGTWYLEQTIGRKRAKELWYLNAKWSAHEAREIGLVNEVVADADACRARAREIAATLLDRGPGALAGLKAAFSSRHTGVIGQARLAHDVLLTHYLATDEAHELSSAFAERRSPDRDRYGR